MRKSIAIQLIILSKVQNRQFLLLVYPFLFAQEYCPVSNHDVQHHAEYGFCENLVAKPKNTVHAVYPYLVKKLKTLDKLFDNVIIMVHLFHIVQNIIIQISTIAIFDKKPEFIIHQMTRGKFAFQNTLKHEVRLV